MKRYLAGPIIGGGAPRALCVTRLLCRKTDHISIAVDLTAASQAGRERMRIKLIAPKMSLRPMDSEYKRVLSPPLSLLAVAALTPARPFDRHRR